MKHIIRLLQVCVLFGVVFLSGCRTGGVPEKLGTEMPFTVIKQDQIPKELLEIIQENRQDEIRMSYVDGGCLYAVRGYGEQSTGGYSIQVNGVWLRDGEIHVDASLLGPSPDKEIQEEPSYPYMVLQMEQREEAVVFD